MTRMVVSGTNGMGVNVREQPDVSSRRVGGLAEGVIVDADERAWRRVRTGVVDGWVAAEYLARGIPALANQPNWAGVRVAVNGGLNGWQRFADLVDALEALP